MCPKDVKVLCRPVLLPGLCPRSLPRGSSEVNVRGNGQGQPLSGGLSHFTSHGGDSKPVVAVTGEGHKLKVSDPEHHVTPLPTGSTGALCFFPGLAMTPVGPVTDQQGGQIWGHLPAFWIWAEFPSGHPRVAPSNSGCLARSCDIGLCPGAPDPAYLHPLQVGKVPG